MKCGDCTLCCEVLPIKEIQKPENTLCSNCTSNKGCNIYKDRPESCKNFDCIYTLSKKISIKLRPDRCNVIFERITTKIYLAISHHKEDNAWQKPIVANYIKKLNSQGISVVTSSFTNTPIGVSLAKGHTAEGVKRVISK